MKKLEVNQMENLDGGKFWGWNDWKPMGPCTNGKMTMVRVYDVLWMATDYDYNIVNC